MKKVNITLTFDDDKLDALEFSLRKEHSSVQARMDDALILPFRKLIAQLVQHILQMLLQGFIIEMFLNGPFPSLVDPQNDFFLL